MLTQMRWTKDTFTGKPFRWNTIVVYRGKRVPARCTARDLIHLAPDRVPKKLLDELNPGDK